MAEIKSFPNNQDEFIGAEYVMRWLHGRTSGVFGAVGNAAVAPVLDTMAVTVSDGNGWISNDNADGVVWWIDNEAASGSKLQLPIDMADAVLPRIDRVVVSWATTNYVALPEVSILKGTAASTPVAPTLTNNNVLRQISLAAITVPAGATAITSAMITDERLDPALCGIVTENIVADTSMISAQYENAVADLKNAIAEAWKGEIPKGAISQRTTAIIPVSGWVAADDLYTNEVSVTGILSDDEIIIDANMEGVSGAENMNAANEAMSMLLSASCNTDGILYVVATEIPEVDIPVKILRITK